MSTLLKESEEFDACNDAKWGFKNRMLAQGDKSARCFLSTRVAFCPPKGVTILLTVFD